MSKITVSQKELKKIIHGACLLASGGGGSFSSAANLIQNFTKENYPKDRVNIVSKEDANPDGYSVVVAYIGSPDSISQVKIPHATIHAVQKIQAELAAQGKKLKYLVPVETGVLGLVVPCLVAAKLGLEVIDGAGAGRAVPKLSMLSFSAENINVSPTYLCNAKGLSVTLNLEEAKTKIEKTQQQELASTTIENLARPIISIDEFHQYAGLAMWVMNYKDLQKALKVTKSYSLCNELGKRITTKSKSSTQNIVSFLKNQGIGTKEIFKGQMESVTTSTAGGFDLGKVTLSNPKQKMTLLFQNESLLLWDSKSNHPVVMAPDSIAYYVENDTQHVYSNGDLLDKNGKLKEIFKNNSVSILAMKSDAYLRKHDDRLQKIFAQSKDDISSIMHSFMTNLNQLGYYGKYIPVEKTW